MIRTFGTAVKRAAVVLFLAASLLMVTSMASPAVRADVDYQVQIQDFRNVRITIDSQVYQLNLNATEDNPSNSDYSIQRVYGPVNEPTTVVDGQPCSIRVLLSTRTTGQIDGGVRIRAWDGNTCSEDFSIDGAQSELTNNIARSSKYSGAEYASTTYRYGDSNNQTIRSVTDMSELGLPNGLQFLIEYQGSRYFYNTAEADQTCADFAVLDDDNTMTYMRLERGSGQAVDIPTAVQQAIDYQPGCYEAERWSTSIAPYDAFASSENAFNGGVVQEQLTCEERITARAFAWIVCSMFDLVEGSLNALESAISKMLRIDRSEIGYIQSDSEVDNPVYKIWQAVRNVARITFLVSGLVIIMGSMTNFEVFAAYRWQKSIVPAFLAIVMMEVSWFAAVFGIEVTNDIADGIRSLITNVIEGFAGEGALDLGNLNGGWTPLGVAGVGLFVYIGGSILGVLPAVALALGAMLSLIIGFLVLGMREVLVITLLITSPIGAALFANPATRGVAKTWWSWYTKTLIVYPLFVLIVYSGQAVSYVTAQTAGAAAGDGEFSGQDLGNMVVFFSGQIARFAGPFMLIFIVKFAGGILQTFTGFLNDKSRGFIDNHRKIEAERNAKNFKSTLAGARLPGDTFFGRAFNDVSGMIGSITTSPIAFWKAMHHTENGRGLRSIMDMNRMRAADIRGEDWRMKATAQMDRVQFLIGTRENRRDARSYIDSLDIDEFEREGWLADLAKADQIGWGRDYRIKGIQNAAASGYNFGIGRKGYDELRNSVISITGSDRNGEYISMMNYLQYTLKESGRPEFGGINNGSHYDPFGGVKKLDTYRLGRLKPNVVEGYREMINGWHHQYQTAPTRQAQLDALKKLYQFRSLQDAVRSSATVGTRDGINKLFYGTDGGFGLDATISQMLQHQGLANHNGQPNHILQQWYEEVMGSMSRYAQEAGQYGRGGFGDPNIDPSTGKPWGM